MPRSVIALLLPVSNADRSVKNSARLCLAASGGGHIRQLLDLEPVWRNHNIFFVTEDTALGQSIAEKHPAYFVSHVALGQARLGAPIKMLFAGIRNCLQSARIIWRERPDVVITTGAGSMFFTVLWARLLGARIILVDSFARFKRPSAFAKIAGPFAHVRISQAPEAAANWPGARLFDPFRILDAERPAKERLLFATVGATLPFDRLVKLVAKAKTDGLIDEHVIIQTGKDGAQIAGLETHETLPFDAIKQLLQRADIVVCHGGTGSLITALQAGCRVIGIPRSFALGEHYDDHQVEICQAFADRGLIAVVGDDEDLGPALDVARSMVPRQATTDPKALIEFLNAELSKPV